MIIRLIRTEATLVKYHEHNVQYVINVYSFNTYNSSGRMDWFQQASSFEIIITFFAEILEDCFVETSASNILKKNPGLCRTKL